MSIYKIPCPVCGGSNLSNHGSYQCGFCHMVSGVWWVGIPSPTPPSCCNGEVMNVITDPCPDCDKGYFTLEVEKPCSTCPNPGELPENRGYGCHKDGGQCDIWTPMTEEEIREIYNDASKWVDVSNPKWTKYVIEQAQSGHMTFKGRKVRIAK